MQLAENVIESLWFGDEEPERSALEASNSLAVKVAHLSGLKPFPAEAQKVMEMASRDDCSMSDIARVIKSDPSMAVRVMRLANSSLFGGSQSTDDLDSALARLGMQNIYQMVTALAVVGMFTTQDKTAITIKNHCVGVAAIARYLAHRKDWEGSNQLFLCGLMHDVGKLLLLQTEEFSYAKLSDEDLAPNRVQLLEREALGYDHAVLGGHVLTVWDLPNLVAEAVAWHHQPSRAYAKGGDHALLVAFLRCADQIDHALEAEGAPTPEFLELIDGDAAREYTGLSGADLEGLWEELRESRLIARSAFSA